MTKYLCVYCGASERADPIYRQAAIDMGRLIGQNQLGLVYGGGRMGLMGLVADAALENGGRVIGFTTEHLNDREGAHHGLTELHIVDTMHTRKMNMSEQADMFVILPGGFGTLDEMFEILTWKQLNFHSKPIVVVNINQYWDPLVDLYNKVFDSHFALDEHRGYIKVVSSVDEVMLVAKELSKEN
jgi:uncharacterized protein (TIGR00730 family)